MKEAVNAPEVPRYDPLPFELGTIIRLLVVGVVTGALGWLLYMAISKYFIVPVFCRSADAFAICNNGGTIAWIAAHLIVAVGAVAVLARMGVYRPLLVAIAVIASLWSAHAWLGVMPWWMGMVWQAGLFGLAFALFGWLARATNLIFVVVLTVILVVLSRLILLWA